MRKQTSVLINKVAGGNKTKARRLKKFYIPLPAKEKCSFKKEMIAYLNGKLTENMRGV